MSDQLPFALLQAAADRGLLALGTALRPLAPGNADRRVRARRSWVGRAASGGELILTTGTELVHLMEVQSAMARDCPALVRAPLCFLSLPAGDLLVEAFCPDPSLAILPVNEPKNARRATLAFASACAALALTEEGSTEEARRAEWSAWSARITTLPCWQPSEVRLLTDRVLPALYSLPTSSRPVTRWSNGDFTAGNLLVSPAGEPRLIDFEYARRTHFFAEDAARFHTLSALARQRPDLFGPALPRPGPAAQLHFWLRQIELEVTHNTPAYVARVWPRRLAVVRRLAEQILGVSAFGWSVPALPLTFNVETARWAGDGSPRLLFSGWCHVPAAPAGVSVVLHAGERLLAETPLRERPDVEQHLASSPGSRLSGFILEPSLPGPDLTLTLSLLDAEGTLLPFHTLHTAELPGRGPFQQYYAAWAERHYPDPPATATTPPSGPLLSVLVPVYRSDRGFLHACVDSVRRQHHTRWELILIDDGSGDTSLTRLLDDWARTDRRIRVKHRATNGGIARATNDALAAARGDYIVLLDHDDVLRPHALAALADRLAADPALDAIYSDEEKISPTGERLLPFLKPAFSPEFLRGVMYPGHALCVRRTVAQAAGGFDPAFDGVQDYEFFLRVTEHTTRIAHLPRILYQWRQSPGSSALHGNVKGDMDRKQAEAVRAHLQRTGDPRLAIALGGHRVRLEATQAPTFKLVSTHEPSGAVRALLAAASSSTAEILVLVGPGDAPFDEGSLRELCVLAALPDSGCVGPLLVSPQDRVIASGLTSDGDRLVPVMAGFDASGDGYNGSLRCNREVLAVPPVGVAIRRQLLVPFPVHTDDWFTFSAALSATGLFHRICASARLVVASPLAPLPITHTGHLASSLDPYYNPHFNRSPGDYSLAGPPEHLPAPARQSVFHFDELPRTFSPDGCVTLRGWCFRRDGHDVRIRARLGRRAWSTACDQPRPDVAAGYPAGLTDGRCGFALRLHLPAGEHELALEAVSESDTAETLLTRRVAVPPFAALCRMLFAKPPVLLAHQLPAWAAHEAKIHRPESFPTIFGRREKHPTITIVTPSFQQAAFLEETMRSVLSHPPERLSYVVQDGGSSDGSVDIIRRHADRVHAWSSAPDSGQADAIARGFAKTTGEPDDIMAWINSDDFYLPGTLPFVADWFARHPEVDAIYGHRILVDENSHEIGRWFLPPHDPEVLRLNDFVPQETLFWRRRIWDKVGGIDASLKFAMDWDLLLRFQAAGARIVRVPYFLACFRIHSAQKTSAQMHSVGQAEIDRLRTRTNGRVISPAEIETHPRLIRYLRRSAFIESLWRLGLRAR